MSVVHDDQLFAELARARALLNTGLPADSAFMTALDAVLDLRYVQLAGGVILTDSQVITTATASDITWGTEVSDPDGWTAGAIATLTVPANKGQRYAITYTGGWSADPVTGLAAIFINGAASTEERAGPGIIAPWAMATTIVRTLAAGDTIKVQAYQTSGSDKTLSSRLEVCPV